MACQWRAPAKRLSSMTAFGSEIDHQFRGFGLVGLKALCLVIGQ